MTTLKRSLIALSALLLFAAPALAGPPLICHPFETGGGKLLAWGAGTSWNSPLGSYDITNLVAETTALLTADAPVLTRMENMRRATIYAMRDPGVANALLKAVVGRALASTTDARALFDAGYLVETYKQAVHMRQDTKPELRLWAPVDEAIKLDGYAWVKKALSMSAPSAEMEFAASLMTRDPIAAAHRAKALEVAGKGSLVARNIAKLGF
jgi:hypothetical protein